MHFDKTGKQIAAAGLRFSNRQTPSGGYIQAYHHLSDLRVHFLKRAPDTKPENSQGFAMATQANSQLLATDRSNSLLQQPADSGHHGIAYSPFGYRRPSPFALGFNGQIFEPAVQGYLLGNGYRLFRPVLRRFYSPDAYSPFGAGGLNAYAYCVGDPVNNADPSGHLWGPLKKLGRALNIIPAKKITRAGSVVSLPVGHPGTSSSSLAGHHNALSTSVPAHLNHVAPRTADDIIPSQKAILQKLERNELYLSGLQEKYNKYLKKSPLLQQKLTVLIEHNTGELIAQRTWLSRLEDSAAAAVQSRQAASRRPVPFDGPPAFEPPPLYASRNKAGDKQFLIDLNQYIRMQTDG